LAALLLLLSLLPSSMRRVDAAANGGTSAAIPITAVGTVAMTVADLARSLDFYMGVLPFVPVSDVEQSGREFELQTGVFGARARTVTLRLGQETIALREFIAPKGRPFPDDFRPNDAAFQHVAIIVSDMDRAYERLRAKNIIHGSTSPQRLPDWNPNAGGIKAFYFRDPDGHFLEILQFPEGKGASQWQRKDQLFLGIDHTAIVSTDTDRSLAFYRGVLHMNVAGESENYDTEQEHLNNVFAARLRITALRAARGPGIELLEYLAPRTGRPAPSDLSANDTASWQTTLHTAAELTPVATLARQHLFTLVSPFPTTAQTDRAKAIVVRDPDGHAMRLLQEPLASLP
jgi:catechol 2,3-dioxygenase-like lactoylglutathione lyase family enzyme